MSEERAPLRKVEGGKKRMDAATEIIIAALPELTPDEVRAIRRACDERLATHTHVVEHWIYEPWIVRTAELFPLPPERRGLRVFGFGRHRASVVLCFDATLGEAQREANRRRGLFWDDQRRRRRRALGGPGDQVAEEGT